MAIKQISEKLSQLIRRLSSRSEAEMPEPELVKLVEDIGYSNCPFAINSILKYCFDGNCAVQETALKTITKLYKQIKSKDLVSIDENLRRNSFFYSQSIEDLSGDTRRVVSKLKNMNIDKKYEQAFLSILSSNPNGYVREAALKLLIEKNYDCLNVLVLRSNDWVPEIRIYANTMLREKWNDFSTEALINSIPLAERLMQKTRIDNSGLIKSIKDRIKSSEGAHLLFNTLTSDDYIAARYAYHYLSEDTHQIIKLVNISAKHEDVVIRANALKLAKQNFRGDELRDILDIMIDDPSTMIKRNVLYGYLEYFPEKSEGVLKNTLFHKAKSLRQFSRFYLRENGIDSFADLYREKLKRANPKEIYGAISGLGETGTSDDFDVIKKVAQNGKPSIKAASLQAATLLKPEDWTKLILDKLEHGLPSEVKIAEEALKINRDHFDVNDLKNIYSRTNSEHLLEVMHRIFESKELNTFCNNIHDCISNLTIANKWGREDLPRSIAAIRHNPNFKLIRKYKLEQINEILDELMTKEQNSDFGDAKLLVNEYIDFVRY